MAPLTPRQERFCQSFVLNPNAAGAARDAGYAPRTAKHQGSRLLKKPAIAARIQDIQWALADDFGRDVGTLIGKLESVYRRAMADGRYHAAAHAVKLQADLSNPRQLPYRLWRQLAEAAANTLAANDGAKAAAASPPAAMSDAPPGGPRPAAGGLRAVGE